MSGWDGGEHVAAAGTRMYAATAGPAGAPPVVCVHGLGCLHGYFEPFAGNLAAEARVVAPDLPRFGRTRGPLRALDVRGLSLALADWLRATGRGRSALVANSNGCQVVVDLAVHSPQLLGPVVLVGPTVDPAARSASRQAARLFANQPFERPSLIRALLPAWIECGPRRYAETFAYMLHDPVERKLRHVDVPALVVRGQRDPVVPRRWAEEVAARLPHGRLDEVPGVGHTVNWSAPKALAELTRPPTVG